MSQYTIGQVLENPVSKDKFLFAGYAKDGHEYWCDIVEPDEGGTYLNPPHRRIFKGWNGKFTAWEITAHGDNCTCGLELAGKLN